MRVIIQAALIGAGLAALLTWAGAQAGFTGVFDRPGLDYPGDDSRFWTIVDLILYGFIALVFSAAFALGRGRRRDGTKPPRGPRDRDGGDKG